MSDDEDMPERFRTLVLGPQATQSLLERLRPLVYVSGACSCCGHSAEEQEAIGRELLAWWTDQNIDDLESEVTP